MSSNKELPVVGDVVHDTLNRVEMRVTRRWQANGLEQADLMDDCGKRGHILNLAAHTGPGSLRKEGENYWVWS